MKVLGVVGEEHHFTEGIVVYALLTNTKDLKERNFVYVQTTTNINARLKYLPVCPSLNGWKIVYEL